MRPSFVEPEPSKSLFQSRDAESGQFWAAPALSLALGKHSGSDSEENCLAAKGSDSGSGQNVLVCTYLPVPTTPAPAMAPLSQILKKYELAA